MKAVPSKFLKVLCTTLLLLSSVSSHANEEPTERKRVPIGEDTMSVANFEAANEESTERKRVPVGEDAMSAIEYLATQEERAQRAHENGQEQANDEEKITNNAYTSVFSHPFGLHRPVFIAPLGETIELEDGSVWWINPSDRSRTSNWLNDDIVIIAPNDSWFSSYMFKIVNQNSGEVLKANMHLGPYYNGPKTHCIVGFDHVNDLVYLQNGSGLQMGTIWRIAGHDLGLTKQWRLNDTVIIGINPGWDSDTRPNILINVRKLNYACVKCFN